MLGTIVNTVAIAAGTLAGLALRKGLPDRYHRIIMQAVGLAVVVIGLKGALKSDDLLVVIISLVIGTLAGEWLDIEALLDRLGQALETSLGKKGGNLSKGFVTASLIFCVGAMAIVGSLESGLNNNNQTLFAKSVLDGVTSVVLASSLGFGVFFSAVSVLVYQGLITLAAGFLKPVLTPNVIVQMSSVGGILIMAIGLNLLDLTRIKIGNMLPAIFMPLFYLCLQRLWAII
jgi:uncharacterized membrane protein YqgA involved in biofilm formation